MRRHLGGIGLTVLMALSAGSASAQQGPQGTTPRNQMDLRLGYGIGTVPELVEGITTAVAGALVPGGYRSVDVSGGGVPFVTVLFRADRRFSWGLELGYESIESRYNYLDGSSATTQNRWYTAMLRGDVAYLQRPTLRVYGNGALGFTIPRAQSETGSDTSAGVAFHLSPVGVRAGSRIAGWAELGFGFRGILSAGLAVRP